MTLLVLGSLALLSTVVAGVRVRRPAWFSLPIQLVSMFVGETAVFHAAAQAVVTAALVAGGALHGPWGWAGFVAMVASMVGLIGVQLGARAAAPTLVAAVAPLTGPVTITRPPLRRLLRPLHMDRTCVEVIRDIPYGPDKRQRLDLYRPTGAGGPWPVLFHIHGGGWVSGDKRSQGLPLLHEAARRGYLGVSVNYRLAPRHKYPAWIHDVKAALVWVRRHVAEHGGDPSWIATTGGSAGGHLAAVLATTPNEPSLQPDAIDVDTAVDACVPVYGAFDFTDRWGIRASTSMVGFLEKMVMSSKLAADRATWELVSPAYRGDAATPPFFVIHGAIDVLLYREETRAFVEHLRAVSGAPVLYAEIPHAQHAFDLMVSVRALAMAQAVVAFLDAVRAGRAQPGSDSWPGRMVNPR